MSNPAELDDLARASAATGDLVDRIPADQWDAPTPCAEWSVRDVVRHLVAMNLVLVAMFEESPMPERRADPLGADPAAAFRRSAAALQDAVAPPGVLERSRATPVGVATGAERLQWRVVDLVAHAWDLAQATDLTVEVPDDVLERVLMFARLQLPGRPHAGRFADPQPIGDDAPVIDRLAALTGRPVPWTNRATRSEAMDAGPFFHGTKADVRPGELLEPGYSSNFGDRARAGFIYLTATLDAATWGAELAVGEGRGRIYRVRPTGPFEDDPNLTDMRFPGNPTRSYRTRDPLRVVDEVLDWVPHPPAVLQGMRDHLEELERRGVRAIND